MYIHVKAFLAFSGFQFGGVVLGVTRLELQLQSVVLRAGS